MARKLAGTGPAKHPDKIRLFVRLFQGPGGLKSETKWRKDYQTADAVRQWQDAQRAVHTKAQRQQTATAPAAGSLADDIARYLAMTNVMTLVSFAQKQDHLELWAAALGRDRPRASVTTEEIRIVLNQWKVSPGRPRGPHVRVRPAGLNVETLRKRRGTLHGFYNAMNAEDERLREERGETGAPLPNPVQHAKLPASKWLHTAPAAMEPADVDRILNAMNTYKRGPTVLTAEALRLRVYEALRSGPATAAALAQRLKEPVDHVRPRCTELLRQGLVRPIVKPGTAAKLWARCPLSRRQQKPRVVSLAPIRLRVSQRTGLPPGIIAGLRPADFKRRERALSIERHKGAGVEPRLVPLGAKAFAAMEAFAAAGAWGPYSIAALNNVFKQTAARLGITGVWQYRLRHTFLTEVYRERGDLATVGRLGMHAAGSPVTGKYTKAAHADVDRAAADAMDAAWERRAAAGHPASPVPSRYKKLPQKVTPKGQVAHSKAS